jgi:hypothetical protein
MINDGGIGRVACILAIYCLTHAGGIIMNEYR